MQDSPELNEEDVAYRQVSPAAVVALLLGVASLVAFVGPAFFLIPVAAIGAGLIALGKISRSGGTATGEGLARCGIALALACMAGAVVRESVRDALMQRQAAETARQWLDLLANGRIKDARDLLTADGASALLPSREPGGPAMTPEQSEAIILDGLRDLDLTHAVAAAKGAVTVEEARPPVFEGGRAVVGVGVTIGAGDEHSHAMVQLSRMPRYEAEGRPWKVERWHVETPHANH